MKPVRYLLPSWMLLLVCVLVAPAAAAPPWQQLIPFRRVEANPKKSYALTEQQGPWLILVSSFAGENAEQQAHDLVMELRSSFRVPAYVHRRTYDYTAQQQGLGLNRYGGPKKMRYRSASRFEEFAVLIGNFDDVRDPNLERTLQKMKYARPKSLDLKTNKSSSQRLALLREIHRRVNTDPSKRTKGPMGSAFATRNPLLPTDAGAQGGLDKLVLEMNRNVEFGLLKNTGKFTVKVATFRGHVTMKLDEIDRLNEGGKLPNKLAEAADKAHRLTAALRRKGVEAWEFHDRHESVVTIGSFQQIGAPGPEGRIELTPQIHQIMKSYGAKKQALPGRASAGLVPQRLNGIAFDVQPMPVHVPRPSISQTLTGVRR